MTIRAGQPTGLSIDEGWPGLVGRVYDRIATAPDGLTRGELGELFPEPWRLPVTAAVRVLIERGRVVEVIRVFPPGEQVRRSHRRLMALKSRSIRD